MSISMNIAVSLVNDVFESYSRWQKESGNWDHDSQSDASDWYSQTIALLGADVPDIVGLNSQEVYRLVHFLHERDWRLSTGPREPLFPMDCDLAYRLLKFVK